MKVSQWSLDRSLDEERIARLKELQKLEPAGFGLRWDGRGTPNPANAWDTEPRLVLAGCTFRAGPGREADAALAWATELSVYFKRGVGEPPTVTYKPSVLPGRGGIYVVVGLMQTTHPGDYPSEDGIVWFT